MSEKSRAAFLLREEKINEETSTKILSAETSQQLMGNNEEKQGEISLEEKRYNYAQQNYLFNLLWLHSTETVNYELFSMQRL